MLKEYSLIGSHINMYMYMHVSICCIPELICYYTNRDAGSSIKYHTPYTGKFGTCLAQFPCKNFSLLSIYLTQPCMCRCI